MTASSNFKQIAKQAQTAYLSEDYLKAAELYQEAATHCEQAGDRLTAAEMANNRSVALLKGGDARAALTATAGSDRLFAEVGDFKRQAIALGNRAAALEALGELKPALTTYQECAELLKQANEKELLTYVLKTISALQLRTGMLPESIASMQAAMETKPKQNLLEKIIKKILRIPFRMMR